MEKLQTFYRKYLSDRYKSWKVRDSGNSAGFAWFWTSHKVLAFYSCIISISKRQSIVHPWEELLRWVQRDWRCESKNYNAHLQPSTSATAGEWQENESAALPKARDLLLHSFVFVRGKRTRRSIERKPTPNIPQCAVRQPWIRATGVLQYTIYTFSPEAYSPACNFSLSFHSKSRGHLLPQPPRTSSWALKR